MSKLFTVPISTGGIFECTSPSKDVYLLSFSSPPDNRVTTPLLSAFHLSLDILEQRYPKGVVITTSAIPKFFSNGFDLEHVRTTQGFYEDALFPLLRRLFTYPMPTIAIVNGHTFGAGVFLALAHDYRIQNPSRGYICLNEVDLGIVIPSSIATMLRHMMPSPQMYRTAVLEGKRFGGPEALKVGLVDGLGGMDEALKMISERNLIAKSQLGALGGLKEDAHREALTGFERHEENVKWREGIEKLKEKAAEKAAKDVEKWERNSKL